MWWLVLSLTYASDALVYSPARTVRQSPARSLLGSSRLARRAVTMRGARDDDFDDDDDGDMAGEELEIMIWIEDPKQKQKGAIRCYMESSTELEGNRYALAHPVDIPVIIATCEDEEEGLHALEDDAEIGKVFDIAKKVLAEEGFELKRTPFMLTVEEDEAAFDLDEVEEEEMGDFDGDDDDYDEEDVEEGAEVSAGPRALDRARGGALRAHAERPTSRFAPRPARDPSECAAPILGGFGQILSRGPAVLCRRAARADLHHRAASLGHPLHAPRRRRDGAREARPRAQLHRAQRSVLRAGRVTS